MISDPKITENRRILVIDDNPAIHVDFKKILEEKSSSNLNDTAAALFGTDAETSSPQEGYTLDSAHQGKDGYEMVANACEKNQPYAMAFVDMRMPPGWDGVETIENLWKADSNLQVVICTAYTDYSWAEIVNRLGETDKLLILKKPFDNAEVRQLALAITRKWNAALETQNKFDALKSAMKELNLEINEPSGQH